MQVLAGVSFLFVIVSSLVVGTRMLLLARRTRALPEIALGLLLCLVCGVGYPVAVANQALREILAPGLTYSLTVISMLCINVAFALVFVFTWKVFRPAAAWARNVALLAVVCLAADLAGIFWQVDGSMSQAEVMAAAKWLGVFDLSVIAMGYAWTAVESFHYRSKLTRRLALGLGDPVVCNRFALWGSFGTFSGAGCISIATLLWLGVDVTMDVAGTLAISITGIGQAVCLYLAFVPPKAYLARIRSPRAVAPEFAR
jgi:hypothetical protein